MISRTTKLQLMIFVLITMVGVSFVGAKYARLDKLLVDDDYRVTADFAESGGIFTGAEVTYRGVAVGKVEDMRLSEDGVFVDLAIDDDSDPIPEDVRAVVANKSAVGEQYVDLQPRRGPSPPYLEDGARIHRADTATPISTPTMLLNVDELVRSVDRQSLRTVVGELGTAFQGTGDDLGTIIDTSNSFIETADENFATTRRLLRDGKTVLRTQVQSAGHLRSFARDLRLLSDTLVANDAALRSVIHDGGKAARDLRSFVDENADTLSTLISNLVTTGEITVARLHGIEQVLVLYPYVVEGGFSVLAEDPVSGLHDAHFGLVLTQKPPVCHAGYETTEQRAPQDLEEIPLNTAAHCAEPQHQSNARGAQNHPAPLNRAPLNRAPLNRTSLNRAPLHRAPVVAEYDIASQTVTPADDRSLDPPVPSANAAQLTGEESWKWLLMSPLADRR